MHRAGEAKDAVRGVSPSPYCPYCPVTSDLPLPRTAFFSTTPRTACARRMHAVPPEGECLPACPIVYPTLPHHYPPHPSPRANFPCTMTFSMDYPSKPPVVYMPKVRPQCTPPRRAHSPHTPRLCPTGQWHCGAHHTCYPSLLPHPPPSPTHRADSIPPHFPPPPRHQGFFHVNICPSSGAVCLSVLKVRRR